MHERDIVIGTLLEDACLTLEEFCGVCAVSEEWVAWHVREGRLPAAGNTPLEWRFGGRELRRAREIRRLERDFDAEPELAALVVDLMEQLEALRARLRHAG
jgi:chaperone modulatory protein CbpM